MLDRETYLKFRRAHDECLLCGCSLPSAGKHPSVLEMDTREEVIRRDFCPKCWEQSANAGYFSYWLTKRVSEPTARERRLARGERNDALWRLFVALSATDSPEYGPQLFLLAHLLLRYRVLAFRGTAPDGMLIFAHAQSGEEFRLPDIPVETVQFDAIMKSVEEQAVALASRKDEPAAG